MTAGGWLLVAAIGFIVLALRPKPGTPAGRVADDGSPYGSGGAGDQGPPAQSTDGSGGGGADWGGLTPDGQAWRDVSAAGGTGRDSAIITRVFDPLLDAANLPPSVVIVKVTNGNVLLLFPDAVEQWFDRDGNAFGSIIRPSDPTYVRSS